MIACDCSRDWSDEPGPVLFTEAFRRAAAVHKCCECKSTIAKGETYEDASGLWDGQWAHYRTCLPCAAIRKDYMPGGWAYGYLAQDIMDCLGFDYRTVPDAEEAFERECGAA